MVTTLINFRPNRPDVVKVKLHNLGLKIVPYRWPPCNYWKFPNLKNWLQRGKFSMNEEVSSAVNKYYTCFEFFLGQYIWNLAGAQ